MSQCAVCGTDLESGEGETVESDDESAEICGATECRRSFEQNPHQYA